MKVKTLLAVSGLMATFQAYGSGSDVQALVSTDSEALLSLVSNPDTVNGEFDGIREFLTCFVDNMDLPATVFVECGKAVAEAGLTCQESGLSIDCFDALTDVSKACAEPIAKTIQSTRICMNPEDDDTNDSYLEDLGEY